MAKSFESPVFTYKGRWVLEQYDKNKNSQKYRFDIEKASPGRMNSSACRHIKYQGSLQKNSVIRRHLVWAKFLLTLII